MKKKIMLLCAIFSLFSIVTFAAPDFNNPATETGVIHASNDGKYYVNGYKLQDLENKEKVWLHSLVGKTAVIKGFFEKKPHFNDIDAIYVTEVTAY